MTVLDVIRKRYSCRAYMDKPIEQEKISQVLEAARLAPSAKNLQDWRLVVVTDKEKKHKLAEAANNQTFIEKVGIPQDVAIIELMALGYPADKQKEPKREPMERIVCYEKWQF
ncbi:MAG: nitroreductase family protein [Planctomycetota bacterium]|nr:nitroreductase family protein [Planctomycetota bacterium]